MRLAVMLVMATAGTAAAQPTVEQLFDEGRTLLADGHPEEACAKFRAALDIEPADMGPTLNLGLCNEQLGKLATALRWFRRAQQRASELGMHDSEAAAKEKTTELAARVATLKLVLPQALPIGGVIAVDGVKVDSVDTDRIEVDAGHHSIELTLEGARPVHAETDARDGEITTVPMAIPVIAPRHYVVVDRGHDRRRHAYLAGGIGGGLLVGSVALGLIGKHEFDDTEHPTTKQHWKDALRYGDTAMFAAGAAAAGLAVWMYLTAPHAERVQQTVVMPEVTRDTMGVAFTRVF